MDWKLMVEVGSNHNVTRPTTDSPTDVQLGREPARPNFPNEVRIPLIRIQLLKREKDNKLR
jgi:hypothetical protein